MSESAIVDQIQRRLVCPRVAVLTGPSLLFTHVARPARTNSLRTCRSSREFGQIRGPVAGGNYCGTDGTDRPRASVIDAPRDS